MHVCARLIWTLDEEAYGNCGSSPGAEACSTIKRARPRTQLARHEAAVLIWERYGEQAWMSTWREVYVRSTWVACDRAAELRGIADPDTRRSVPVILAAIERAEAARAALSAAFDDPAVAELRVFNLGDGEAMSGVLIAARRGATGATTFLVFLFDYERATRAHLAVIEPAGGETTKQLG